MPRIRKHIHCRRPLDPIPFPCQIFQVPPQSLRIARSDKAKQVIGVESNADAVRDARCNAKINQVRNIRFYQNDAGRFLLEMASQGVKVDVVLMDPPRSGSSEEFLTAVAFIRLCSQRLLTYKL